MSQELFHTPRDTQQILTCIAEAEHAFIKFLAANDLALTGSHQSGIYFSQDSWPLFFDTPGETGQNKDRDIELHWEDRGLTHSRFIWYGSGSRSEYRLTKVGGYFRNRWEDLLGCMLILCKHNNNYRAWVLETESEMESVLNFCGISPTNTPCLLHFDLEERLVPYCADFAKRNPDVFPDTETIAKAAQKIYTELYTKPGAQTDLVLSNPDQTILDLIAIEYALFRYIEKENYSIYLERPFPNLERLLSVSLEIQNRRKIRAGHSLEHHLRYIFDFANLEYEHQPVTEEQKRPDFIFPGSNAYHDPDFPTERLFCLGAKTTCKDRWRQVLSEADRLPQKYIFTLQQGISSAQLQEMEKSGVRLVIPKGYHSRCKKQDRSKLLSFKEFLDRVRLVNGLRASLF